MAYDRCRYCKRMLCDHPGCAKESERGFCCKSCEWAYRKVMEKTIEMETRCLEKQDRRVA